MAAKLLNKNNIKTYPIYKMFTEDLLFYYAIIYLFYTVDKGLSPATVFIVNAISQASKLLLELPCVCFLDFLGNRKSLIISNLLSAFSILLLIIAPSFTWIVISTIVFAFSYDIRQLCETTILFGSFPENRKRNYLFSKYDSKGFSYYFVLDAISTLFTGFLFVINHYLPLILCFITRCISVLLSCKFRDNPDENALSGSIKNENKVESLKKYYKELNHIFKFILHSKRLKCLLTFAGIYVGMLTIFETLRSVVLTDLQVSDAYFGVIFAGIQIVSAISVKFANFYQNRFKNKTLAVFAFSNSFPLIIFGICLLFNWSNMTNYMFLGIWLFLYAAAKAPFYTLIKRYLHSFVSNEVNTKIYAFLIMFECTFGTVFSLVAALLLDHVSVATSIIIIGGALSVIFVLILDYMKSYVGLKPEEYNKNEIIYKKLN